MPFLSRFLSFLFLLVLFPAITGIANAAGPENAATEVGEAGEADETKVNDARSGSGQVTIIETAAGSRFRNIDSNNDGYVTVPEWAESDVRADFNDVDADGNGIIDPPELGNHSAFSSNRAQEFGGAPESRARDAQRNNTDARDPEGVVGDRRVQMMGGNLADGTINFSAYDTDGNGMLDRGEASDNRYVTAYFDAWDADGNDLLDPREMKQGSMNENMD